MAYRHARRAPGRAPRRGMRRPTSPRRPPRLRLFASTVASSWPRKHTRPSSPNRTTSPAASRFAGLTKARQREPSSRLISVAEIAGSCSPRPIRRPCKLAGKTLVSLTTMASPRRNRPADSRTVRSSKRGAAPRTTSSFAASRGETGRSAMRSSGSAKSNRSVRIKARLSTRLKTALRSKLVLSENRFPLFRLNASTRRISQPLARQSTCRKARSPTAQKSARNRHERQGRGHPSQTRHRRRHLASALHPGYRCGDSPGGQVTFLAPPSSCAEELLAADPWVAETIYFEHGGSEFKRAANLAQACGAACAGSAFGKVWILDRTLRPALAARLAGIPERIGLGSWRAKVSSSPIPASIRAISTISRSIGWWR